MRLHVCTLLPARQILREKLCRRLWSYRCETRYEGGTGDIIALYLAHSTVRLIEAWLWNTYHYYPQRQHHYYELAVGIHEEYNRFGQDHLHNANALNGSNDGGFALSIHDGILTLQHPVLWSQLGVVEVSKYMYTSSGCSQTLSVKTQFNKTECGLVRLYFSCLKLRPGG